MKNKRDGYKIIKVTIIRIVFCINSENKHFNYGVPKLQWLHRARLEISVRSTTKQFLIPKAEKNMAKISTKPWEIAKRKK